MKRLLSLLMALTFVATAVGSPQAMGDDLDFGELLAIGIFAALGAVVISEMLEEDAQIGVHIEFNERNQRGFHRVVGEGYHRRNQRRCREIETVVVDECGRPIPGMTQVRVECKRRGRGWEVVDSRLFVSDRRMDRNTPVEFNLCMQFERQDDFQFDEPFVNDPNFGGDFFEENDFPPPVIPMDRRQPPAIIPMDQGIVPMFAPATIN